ncbi:hypothetical protein KUH03_00485 [Sphingobacterium sp. E70]|uniref:hypothetical protein n=1 Tax=Sphingobacterium sp. E70 TaxID=2853439 RepID=UPI00211B953F|nr:hypothetical protein [Sphingobacterium sp. E70]ULT25529.1 hypothetical protein KUH03_00485 [Sphingobacterium sp. E70]
MSKEFLSADDKVLFIDDFLANGNAAFGMLDLIQQSGAALLGMGFIIEKSFQEGGKRLRELSDIRIESLARIKSLEVDKVSFEED